MQRWNLLGGVVVLLALLVSGCLGKYKSDFSVIVENRAINSIAVSADGTALGTVTSGQSATFTLQLLESNANTYSNGIAPTPQAAITLTAKDAKTGALSTDKPITVTTASPTHVTFSASDFPSAAATVARFTTSPTNPSVNQSITFNATSSTATNGVYSWDFGDGQGGAGTTTTHAYIQPGTFTVVLTVTSDTGQSSTSSRSVTISAALPGQAANYTFSPTQPAINQDVVFTATGAGNVQGGTYAWDFGDGTAGTGVTVTHKYTVAGTFATTLRVISNTGQSATASRTITVTGSLPAGSVNFTISPTSAGVNDIVNFNAAVSTGLNLTFKWDFGDGGSGSGQTTTHSYTNTGTFTVTLTGTNNLGQKIAVSKTIAISGGSTQLAAEFSSSPLDPTISLGTNTVYFDATPSTPGVSTWRWDFGDGANGAGQKLTHTYVQAGTWVVRLVVTDASGRTATVTHSVIVKP